VQALRRKVEILTFHKSNLAAEIEKLRAACNRRANHNSVLKMKLDVWAASHVHDTALVLNLNSTGAA